MWTSQWLEETVHDMIDRLKEQTGRPIFQIVV